MESVNRVGDRSADVAGSVAGCVAIEYGDVGAGNGEPVVVREEEVAAGDAVRGNRNLPTQKKAWRST